MNEIERAARALVKGQPVTEPDCFICREEPVATELTLRDRLIGVLRSALLDEIAGSINGVMHVYVGEATIRLDVITDALLVELNLGIPCVRTGCRMRQIPCRFKET